MAMGLLSSENLDRPSRFLVRAVITWKKIPNFLIFDYNLDRVVKYRVEQFPESGDPAKRSYTCFFLRL